MGKIEGRLHKYVIQIVNTNILLTSVLSRHETSLGKLPSTTQILTQFYVEGVSS